MTTGPVLVTLEVKSCRDCIYNVIGHFRVPVCSHPTIVDLYNSFRRSEFDRELPAKFITPYWCPEDIP